MLENILRLVFLLSILITQIILIDINRKSKWKVIAHSFVILVMLFGLVAMIIE